MLPTYMKKKGDVIYYDGDGELIYYIPEKYFSTNNAIMDISLEVGFDNLSYFNKLFKRKYNLTPKEFRTINSTIFK